MRSHAQQAPACERSNPARHQAHGREVTNWFSVMTWSPGWDRVPKQRTRHGLGAHDGHMRVRYNSAIERGRVVTWQQRNARNRGACALRKGHVATKDLCHDRPLM